MTYDSSYLTKLKQIIEIVLCITFIVLKWLMIVHSVCVISSFNKVFNLFKFKRSYEIITIHQDKEFSRSSKNLEIVECGFDLKKDDNVIILKQMTLSTKFLYQRLAIQRIFILQIRNITKLCILLRTLRIIRNLNII